MTFPSIPLHGHLDGGPQVATIRDLAEEQGYQPTMQRGIVADIGATWFGQ